MIFTTEQIARFVVAQVPSLKGIVITSAGGCYSPALGFRVSRGRRRHYVIPLCMPNSERLQVRSVLLVTSPSGRYSYVINGQAGRGTREIAFWGERGPALIPSVEQVRAHFAANFGSKNAATFFGEWENGFGRWADGAEAVVVGHGERLAVLSEWDGKVPEVNAA